jgi:hypothetical protein
MLVFETRPKDQLHKGDRKRDPKSAAPRSRLGGAFVTAPLSLESCCSRAQTVEANSALAAAAPPAPMSTLAGPFARPGCWSKGREASSPFIIHAFLEHRPARRGHLCDLLERFWMQLRCTSKNTSPVDSERVSSPVGSPRGVFSSSFAPAIE